ncbi:MAG: Gfo/Idh/MocA family oxidoreductase [Candidatus Hermodarchaeota archaeon]
MSLKSKISTLLIGAGPMAAEYSKVLTAMEIPTILVGRGKESAQKFKEITGLNVYLGGIDKWLKSNNNYPNYAIVAVSGTELSNVTRSLLKSGFKKILLEKPGGLNYEDIKSLALDVKKYKADVVLGYNRHFYSSVLKAQELIKNDGGVNSFYFEFTEWSHVIEKLEKHKEIKSHWLLHNSTHVIDLAFYLGGLPERINCYKSGGFKWHPDGAIFTGSGITKNGALFAYHSNWDAPGRWGVEILTKNNRLIFRPLEKLKIQKRGSIAIEEVDIDDDLDIKFKPGLYREVSAFLSENYKEFIDIHQQVKHLKYFEMINKGQSS